MRRGLLIQPSILQELVPEMVPFPVLQHQIAKFGIKHGKFHKESIHKPSIFLSLSAANKEFHYNARIAEKTPFTDAKSDPVCTRQSCVKSPFTVDGIVLGDRLSRK